MAKEADQTRWVGVRPTDPSEDIPTTTKKVTPAVGDLQAVKDVHHEILEYTGQDCTVSHAFSTAVVPADEIWIINQVTAMNNTSLCDIKICVRRLAVFYFVAGFYSIEPGIYQGWNGQIVLANPNQLRIYFELGGVTDDVNIYLFGHKIGVY